jgi:Poly(hydroxyalcanoate) granule associated protein (phasin)
MSKQRTGRGRRAGPRPREPGVFPELGNAHLLRESLQIGLKKLEDVFDERVASALHRLGIPSAKTVERLERRMEELAAQMQTLHRARKKK